MKTKIFSTKKPGIFRFPERSLRSLLLIALFVTGVSFAASAQQNVHYRFRLQGVTDPAGAKMVTDILRPVFNTPEDQDAVFPNFNDELDQFDFFSPVIVSEDQLEAVLAPHGILLTAFSNANETTKPEER
jgi:hypothetical protein